MKTITKKYSNEDITVIWQPDKCIHSAICFNGLPKVFDPAKKPWITMNGALTEQIIDQIEQCPSAALSYSRNSNDSVG